uniref:Nodule-specific cysteine-rich peptide L05 n=1 Tax=Lens culinaris TaxID=3864 RepID=A0A7T8DV70_LENCU|nr:nodule-specific cysteine-rich peptide L05 [Lens culinaris]
MKFIHYKETKSYSSVYLQRENNMAKIHKFVYVLVIFLSLFLFAMGGVAMGGVGYPECFIDEDCKPRWHEYYVSRCIDHKCDWKWKWGPEGEA